MLFGEFTVHYYSEKTVWWSIFIVLVTEIKWQVQNNFTFKILNV